MGALLSFLMTWRAPSIKAGIHVTSSPAVIHLKDSSPLGLQSFLETKCPSLVTGFKPAWWLFNGHLQTFYAVIGDFSKIDEVVYERRLLRVPDGGTLGLDFVSQSNQELDSETPMVVVMHGLTGGSYESYVRSILSVACAPKAQGGLGYRGVVVNFRGCAGLEITSTQFYSGGYTGDLRIALLFISRLYPRAKLMGIGFSLGANVMTRYLGEEGEASKLMSACVLGCPWDLVANSEQLEGRWLSRTIYSKAMADNLRNLIKRHLSSLAQLGPSAVTPHLEPIMKSKNVGLAFVDEHFVRFVGGTSPPFPFPSAWAYYAWASSHHHVKAIRVPFLAINALDDPIVTTLPLPLPAEASSVAIVATRRGGHLGWFQRNRKAGSWIVERWVRQPVCEWLKAVGEEMVFETKGDGGVEEIDGFTCKIGNPQVGYRVMGVDKVVASAGAVGTLGGL